MACIKTRHDADSQLRGLLILILYVCIYNTAVGVSVIEDTVSGEEAVDVDNDGEPGEEAFLEEYTAEGLIEEVRSRPCSVEHLVEGLQRSKQKENCMGTDCSKI